MLIESANFRAPVESDRRDCYPSGLQHRDNLRAGRTRRAENLDSSQMPRPRFSSNPAVRLPQGLVGTMAKSRLAMRREVEAAEAAETETTAKKKSRKSADGAEKTESGSKKRATKGEKDGAPKKKKVAKPRTKRAKEAMQRRRIVWVVYSSTMREEGRFLYHEKDKAEELLATLLGRGKRRYFMQPVKEALNPDGTPIIQVVVPPPEEELEEEVKVDAEIEGAEDIDLDAELEIDEEPEEAEAEAEEAPPEP